ncbi:MAG: Ig-like domain-containing protein [Cocleimonas sp.]
MAFLKSIAILFITSTLVACGGSGGGGGSSDPGVTPETPTSSVSADNNGVLTVSGKALANSTITVTFPDGSTQQTTTDSNGNYTLVGDIAQATGQVTITVTDNNGNTSDPSEETFTADLESKDVLKALYKATGVMPELSFKPSLGINTEAPQGGADTAGMPMPFVDIFRTARPFGELSNIGTAFDDNGWPIQFADGINFARTKLLQGTLGGSIPEGTYTVIYDGDGNETLEFGSSGAVNDVTKIAGENKYTFELLLEEFDGEDEVAAADTNSINMNIRGSTSATTNLKNIRIVMPGGTCSGNPFLNVESQTDCPDGAIYESFADRLEADRNAIIFNPDYLLFLRNFKVVRMMNLMESSLKKLCFNATDCPAEVGTWADRAMLTDAVWGGNDQRTPDEEHKGVAIEVMVELANTLQRDIWVNMPHVADNDYVQNYAKYVFDNLDSNLQVYVEYSNEVWNNGFAAHSYATSQGNALGLGIVPDIFVGSNRDADYFARLNYYSQRAEEMLILWKAEFGGGTDSRLVRVLGSFIGDRVLTEQMLENLKDTNGTINNVDVVAIAPYFFGCPVASQCIDAAKNLLTAATVDDIFDVMDQSATVDVKSIDGTIEAVKNQLTATNANNLKLVSYEGGQHLVTGIFGSNITEAQKPERRKLFNDANRDPRMKQRFITFLDAWKDLADDGTTLFTLYTLPQSFYRFGNFGIKEHLNKPRSESPKFDGVMTFQETHGDCWWDGCNP